MKKIRELKPEEIKYIRNEIMCMKTRLRQIENYRKKISELLDGMTIDQVEKKYGNVTFKNQDKVVIE